MQRLVAGTINKLIQQVCRRASIDPQQIYKAVVAGNPTMMHLFLGIPPEAIRLSPYIPTVNHTPSMPGGAAGWALRSTRGPRWIACRAWPATWARTSRPAC